ncbi:MAG: hypothetical protein IT352_11900 [Gemmatimonadales bacterium]|nr:hypothetical protein [Gemmatimonadales bacterium]
MTMNAAETAYRDGQAAARAVFEAESVRFARLGIARLVVFLVGVGAAAVTVLSTNRSAGWGVVVAAVVFLALLVWHELVARRRDRAGRSMAYYDRGLARLEHRWTDGGDPGDRFRDEQHLYAADLELFGTGSLFHFISTARTETGAATLARWLLEPADRATIAARQEATRELTPLLPLRHDLAVVGAEVKGALDSRALRAWLEGDGVGLPRWLGAAAATLAVVNVAATAAALAGWVPGYVVLPGYTLSLALTTAFRGRIAQAIHDVDRPARDLKLLAALVVRVSRESFRAPLLARLSDTLAGTTVAAVEIRRLERLVDLADARRNQLFAPVAALLLLGTQVAAGVERWRGRMGRTAAGWLDAIGELEALASFAAQAFERPDDAFPEVGPPGAPLVAEGMAHPLLPVGRAVANDLALGEPCRLLVVSGSNMSGKSTLLKALGGNLVLAFAGAPVRARRLSVGQWALGASLVLRESLLEGRSRFYAEVLRLRDIVAVADQGRPVLFLLDELLSGTNSHDRAIGAKGILEGLVAKGAIGIVTTHDLALTEIARTMGDRGDNRHLEDTLVNGELRFDYRLQPGVVRRSNALELMKAVGLEVPRT